MLRIWGYNIKPRLLLRDETAWRRDLQQDGHHEPSYRGRKAGGEGRGGNRASTSRTGEFYVFKSKATIVASGGGRSRLFSFAPELTAAGSMSNMNGAGVGHAIGWNAGAEFVLMEQTGPGRLNGFGYAPYSMGNTQQYLSRYLHRRCQRQRGAVGRPLRPGLKTVEERFFPSPGQKFQLGIGIGLITISTSIA